jgi:hypothetical protein
VLSCGGVEAHGLPPCFMMLKIAMSIELEIETTETDRF